MFLEPPYIVQIRKRISQNSFNETNSTKTIRYSGEGSDNMIKFIKKENQNVWINKFKYFESISEDLWNFEIGGYPVLNKWLKSHKEFDIPIDNLKSFLQLLKSSLIQ